MMKQIEGVSLSVYPTEGSGKTCTKIKETAHTLGGYIGCEPMTTRHGIFQPRKGTCRQSSVVRFKFTRLFGTDES
ncbi:MAG: hypothetical protein J6J71_04005 [Prevotella sp.]|nr:hypothetical protein [Prevotella sp.]